jgi:hypothetical protein
MRQLTSTEHVNLIYNTTSNFEWLLFCTASRRPRVADKLSSDAVAAVTTSECDSGASKVLVVCGVAGQFERVFKRVQQLHASSAGPFDLVLCVGRFFATPSGAQLADESTLIALHQLSDYVAGFRQVPLPTYFIAGPDEDRFLPGTREQLAPNLFYLGRFGIARLRGLRIAYVSGQFGAVPDACSPFLRSGFDSLVATWASDVRRGVDVLLTNEWPRHLLAGVPDAALPASMAVADASAVGVDGVVAVARALKPRYHFAPAVNGAFYLRPPYANRASATDFGRTHVRIGGDERAGPRLQEPGQRRHDPGHSRRRFRSVRGVLVRAAKRPRLQIHARQVRVRRALHGG